MEAMDAIVKMLTELLIENSTMKALLKETAPSLNLNEILHTAKADPEKLRKVESLMADLRTALSHEAAVEDLMARIAATSPNQDQA